MIIACLGDSLTEGDYGVSGKRGIADVHKENYPYFLSLLLNAEVRNFGKCGYDASSYLNYYKEGNVNLNGASVIIIMLGTNGGLDHACNTQGKTYEKADETQLVSAAKCIQTISIEAYQAHRASQVCFCRYHSTLEQYPQPISCHP